MSEGFASFLLCIDLAGDCDEYRLRAAALRITLTALVVLVLGALMTIGGGYLATLGGSPVLPRSPVSVCWWWPACCSPGGARRSGCTRRCCWARWPDVLRGALRLVAAGAADRPLVHPRLWLILPFVNRHVSDRLIWRDGASGLLGIGLLAGALMAGYSLTQDYHSITGEFSDAQMQGLPRKVRPDAMPASGRPMAAPTGRPLRTGGPDHTGQCRQAKEGLGVPHRRSAG